jgi:3-oxoadipate enol-lactonase
VAYLGPLGPLDPDAPPPDGLPPLTTVTLADGRTLRVRDSGGEGPVVVLLHAWAITADVNFAGLMEPLSADYRVVAFDLPGHGPRQGRMEFGSTADEVRDLLDALGVDRAILCGYSMGGPVALEFGLRHPERCAGLVLQATALVYDHLVDRFIVLGMHLARPLARLGLGRTTAARYFANLRGTEAWPWLRRELSQAHPADLIQAGLVDMRYDYRPQTPTLRDTPGLPIAVLVTADDTAVPPADQRAMADALGATTAEIAADHDSFVIAPDLLLDGTRTLLAHVTEASLEIGGNPG